MNGTQKECVKALRRDIGSKAISIYRRIDREDLRWAGIYARAT